VASPLETTDRPVLNDGLPRLPGRYPMTIMVLAFPAADAVWGATITGSASVTPLSALTLLTAEDWRGGRPKIRPVAPDAKTHHCAPMPCTVPSISAWNPLARPVKRSDMAKTRLAPPTAIRNWRARYRRS
jgi:hypothetical protein